MREKIQKNCKIGSALPKMREKLATRSWPKQSERRTTSEKRPFLISKSNKKKDFVQAKMTISKAGDVFEQEADRIAEIFNSIPNGKPQWQRNHGRNQDKPIRETGLDIQKGVHVQRQMHFGHEKIVPYGQYSKNSGQHLEVTPEFESDINKLKGGGQPIKNDVRSLFEQRLGYNFGNVRIHTNQLAGDLVRSLESQAFTFENNIAFAPGQFKPMTVMGRKLIGHELAHVIQQTANSHTRTGGKYLSLKRRSQTIKSRKSAEKNKYSSQTSKRIMLSKENIANIVTHHLSTYREQVREGIDQWKTPKDDSSVLWFLVALGGNLVWAASSFVNPVAATVIRVMSMVGSILGAGTLEKVMEDKAEPDDIKDDLKDGVSRFIDKMVRELNPQVDSLYALFKLLHQLSPKSGWLDANKKIYRRREIVWNNLFGGKVAPWGNSTAIVTRTKKDVQAIWESYKLLWDLEIAELWSSRPRYKGEILKRKSQSIYYKAIVNSGVADRSPAVKISKQIIGDYEYKIYEFPPPKPEYTGATIRKPTGMKVIPIEKMVPRRAL